MIRLVQTGVNEFSARLRGTAPRIYDSVERALLRIMIELQRYIITQKLEGQVLHHRTGNLERAVVYTEPAMSGAIISATIGVSKLAPYAKVHEEGGTVDVREHLRTSKLGKQFSVRAHLATYPARPFLHPSMIENEALIFRKLQIAVNQAL